MKSVLAFAVLTSAAVMTMPREANAIGCFTGGAAGAVAGHYAGHHAVLGAIGGCVVGHHAKVVERRRAAAAAAAQQNGTSDPQGGVDQSGRALQQPAPIQQ